ncbi:MAG: hypothetical protein EB059_09640 [Alphaproteobacteria bacterium]|nr:hypothetical protein [Alphaproteobacteria bacterium]
MRNPEPLFYKIMNNAPTGGSSGNDHGNSEKSKPGMFGVLQRAERAIYKHDYDALAECIETLLGEGDQLEAFMLEPLAIMHFHFSKSQSGKFLNLGINAAARLFKGLGICPATKIIGEIPVQFMKNLTDPEICGVLAAGIYSLVDSQERIATLKALVENGNRYALIHLAIYARDLKSDQHAELNNYIKCHNDEPANAVVKRMLQLHTQRPNEQDAKIFSASALLCP